MSINVSRSFPTLLCGAFLALQACSSPAPNPGQLARFRQQTATQ